MTTPQTPVDAHMALVSEYAIVVMDDYARGFAPGVKQKQARAAVEASARALAAIPAEEAERIADVNYRRGEEIGYRMGQRSMQLNRATAPTTPTAPAQDAKGVDELRDVLKHIAGAAMDITCERRTIRDAALAALRASSPAEPTIKLKGHDAQGDRTQLEWFALAAHWYINASDRELAEQGQDRVDALKQVHLLSGHLEASGFKFAIVTKKSI